MLDVNSQHLNDDSSKETNALTWLLFVVNQTINKWNVFVRTSKVADSLTAYLTHISNENIDFHSSTKRPQAEKNPFRQTEQQHWDPCEW